VEFDQLRTFLAVLEHGSFARAGQALDLGQSTVSFHIKALEQRVGVGLLERGRGRVGPTAEGRLLAPYARRIVGLRDEALARLDAGRTGEAGNLVLAASTIPGESRSRSTSPTPRRRPPPCWRASATSRSSGASRATAGCGRRRSAPTRSCSSDPRRTRSRPTAGWA
jgi:DNA-binding transcriptional LysR family regulator